MISTIHKKRANGFSTLLLTLVVLGAVTSIAFFNAHAVVNQQQTSSNEFYSQQAFNAAQAGLDFGVVYLDKNYDSITNGEIVTGTLNNSGTYSTQIIFKSGRDLVELRSTGVSADGQVQRHTQELVKYTGSSTSIIPNIPIMAQGAINLANNTKVENLQSESTILAGGAVTITNVTAATVTKLHNPSSTMMGLGADVIAGDATTVALTQAAFETTTMGQTVADKAATAQDKLTPRNSDYVYDTNVAGTEGRTISITQTGGTAQIGQNNRQIVIGSPEKPVTLIVNGKLNLGSTSPGSSVTVYGNILVVNGSISNNASSNVTINGLVYVQGTLDNNLENVKINGALLASGNNKIKLKGSSLVKYDPDLLKKTLAAATGGGTTGYGIVVGSWRDNHDS